MSDSVVAKITDNLVAALHGKSLQYNGDVHTITCETQRSTFETAGRNPYVSIFGPWVEVTTRGNRSNDCTLHYSIEYRDNRIDDSYNADSDTATLLDVTKNIAPDIIKLIMVDLTRGGNAMITRWNGHGPRFEGANNNLVIDILIEVQAFIGADDPYIQGA
jgi:hypothetical protein